MLDLLRGPGQPLAAPVRQEMQARLGADFSDVRLHTGAAARASAAGIGARAYTSGSHVVIGDGGADKHTLAHELIHVMQQRQGPVAGTDHGGGLKISSPGDRFEQQADDSARRALSRPAGRTAPGTPQLRAVSTPFFPHFTGAHAVQRESSGGVRPGQDLLALIEELEDATAVAGELAAAGGGNPPTAELNERLKPLREIARGTDEIAKTEALAAVRAELGQAWPAAGTKELIQRRTVQRNGLLKVAVAGTLTVGLGLLAWRVYDYIREQREREQRERQQRERDAELRQALGIPQDFRIPAELLAGIDDHASNAEKAARLFHNVNTFDFTYTGAGNPGIAGMYFREGDCGTLVHIYLDVARASGIENVEPRSYFGRLLVGPRHIHGRDELGNTEGGTHWYFEEHHWVVASGTVYDLLFMASPRPDVYVLANPESGEHKGVTYYRFEGGSELIEPVNGAPIQAGTQGKVFASHAATLAFLDARRAGEPGNWRWE